MFDIWGTSKKGKKKENILGGVLDLGLGLGSSKKNEPERDDKRTFGITLQKRTYDNQKRKCYKCHKPLKISHMEFHHMKAWSMGGKSTSDNCVGLCHNCHKDIHDDERIKASDKKRKSKKENVQYWINPFTGKREKFKPLLEI